MDYSLCHGNSNRGEEWEGSGFSEKQGLAVQLCLWEPGVTLVKVTNWLTNQPGYLNASGIYQSHLQVLRNTLFEFLACNLPVCCNTLLKIADVKPALLITA